MGEVVSTPRENFLMATTGPLDVDGEYTRP